MPAHKIYRGNSSVDAADPANPADPAKVVQARPVRTWVLHAPGAKMMVVYTNSLKIVKY